MGGNSGFLGGLGNLIPKQQFATAAIQSGIPGRGGFLGNLLNGAGYAADFLKGVYSAPLGSPGAVYGLSNVMDRANNRQFLEYEMQQQKRQQLANAKFGNQFFPGSFDEATGTPLSPEDMSKFLPAQGNKDFGRGVAYQSSTGNIAHDWGISPAAQVAEESKQQHEQFGKVANFGNALTGGLNAPFGLGRNARNGGFFPPQMLTGNPISAAPPENPNMPQLEPMPGQPNTPLVGGAQFEGGPPPGLPSQTPIAGVSNMYHLPTDTPPQLTSLFQTGVTDNNNQEQNAIQQYAHQVLANHYQNMDLNAAREFKAKEEGGYFKNYPPSAPAAPDPLVTQGRQQELLSKQLGSIEKQMEKLGFWNSDKGQPIEPAVKEPGGGFLGLGSTSPEDSAKSKMKMAQYRALLGQHNRISSILSGVNPSATFGNEGTQNLDDAWKSFNKKKK